MTTPIETVADALIAFILSLLHDPSAVEEFNDDPAAAMAARGIHGACAADVRSVAPIIVDHPSVAPRPASSHAPFAADPDGDHPDGTPFSNDPEVVREISRIINQFTTIDARATIVDQSTNQNIWTQGGDVTQIFDQDAVVAAGDGSVAAGDDATIDDSDTTIGVGDIAAGNTDGSHNTTVTGVDDDDALADTDADTDAAEPDDAETDAAASVSGDPELDEGLSQAATAIDVAADAAAAVDDPAPEPVQAATAEVDAPLMADLTDTSGIDSAEPLTPPEPEAYPDEPLEDQ
jgi:hypothetical protein